MVAKKSARGRRAIGTPFNLLVTGHSGTGKSAFLKTLYETLSVQKLVWPSETPADESASPFPPTNIDAPTPCAAKFEFDDDSTGERIVLRLIDSPGLPIPVNVHKAPADRDYSHLANAWSDEIIRYLESQFEATLLEESKVKRNPKSPDYQTHACLYLLDPQICYANRGLTPVDRLTLKRLCTRVNVFPCISKADLLTTRQLKDLRKWIMDDINQNDLPIYKFVEDPEVDYDEETTALNAELRSLLPFAIINSEETPDGEVLSPTADSVEAAEAKPKFLGREYTWGIVEVTNPLHCDFIALKQTLFGTHIDELRIVTREALYEQWRTEKLLEVRGSIVGRASVAGSAHNTLEHATIRSQKIAAVVKSSTPVPVEE